MPPTIKRFFGLNNVADPLRLKSGWLQKADNIDITDTGAIVRREGYAPALAGTLSGAFTTFDFARMYVVDAGDLKLVRDDMTTVTLMGGLAAAPMRWTEINDQVFFNNGTDSGIILKSGDVLPWAWPVPTAVRTSTDAGGVLPAGTYRVACTFILPDGRETGASDATEQYVAEGECILIQDIPQSAGCLTQVYIAPADSTVFQLAFEGADHVGLWNQLPDILGTEMLNDGFDPLPQGCDYITVWKGQVCASQYFPNEDMSVVWMSAPLGFHLFNLSASFIPVPGRITMLAEHSDGLIIGTNTRVYAYDGEALKELADYGAVPGHAAVRDGKDGPVLFWTTRGLCSGLPFSNITLRNISVDCGLSAGAVIIQKDGAKRYVVALQKGGEIFNQRST